MNKRRLINIIYSLVFVLTTGLIYYYDQSEIWTLCISIILILFSSIEIIVFKLDKKQLADIKKEKSDSDKTLIFLQSVLLILVIGGHVLILNGIKHELVIVYCQMTLVLIMILVFNNIRNNRKITHANPLE